MTLLAHEAEPVTAIECVARSRKLVGRHRKHLEHSGLALGALDHPKSTYGQHEPRAGKRHALELVEVEQMIGLVPLCNTETSNQDRPYPSNAETDETPATARHSTRLWLWPTRQRCFCAPRQHGSASHGHASPIAVCQSVILGRSREVIVRLARQACPKSGQVRANTFGRRSCQLTRPSPGICHSWYRNTLKTCAKYRASQLLASISPPPGRLNQRLPN
jgi:hypothetical protein